METRILNNFHIITVNYLKDVTGQFFEAAPKELDDKGYYDWVSANLKR